MAASKADEAAGLAPHLTVGSVEASSSRPRLAPGNEDHEAGCYFSPEKPYCPLVAEGIFSVLQGVAALFAVAP